ncbi:hypothetical protein ACGF0J_10165 [Nonomuraea sp. NPDC047897]|uniref:hypothetical protein n=1 Tax=Nonomuraea sp. NPDC047897 TaxID=3364346 RepID=UPI0037232B1F
MSLARRTAVAVLGGAGAAMLVAGPVMVVRGRKGRAEIRAELRAQSITFPDGGPVGDAGRAVLTGPEARRYAQVIEGNLRTATGGRTYAQVSADLMAAGGADEKLAALRRTAFTGQMLRASLLNAYLAWQVTTLVIGLGALLTGSGAALAATAGWLLAEDGDTRRAGGGVRSSCWGRGAGGSP